MRFSLRICFGGLHRCSKMVALGLRLWPTLLFLEFLFAFLFILESVPIVPSAVRATLFSVRLSSLTGHESSNSLLGCEFYYFTTLKFHVGRSATPIFDLLIDLKTPPCPLDNTLVSLLYLLNCRSDALLKTWQKIASSANSANDVILRITQELLN